MSYELVHLKETQGLTLTTTAEAHVQTGSSAFSNGPSNTTVSVCEREASEGLCLVDALATWGTLRINQLSQWFSKPSCQGSVILREPTIPNRYL